MVVVVVPSIPTSDGAAAAATTAASPPTEWNTSVQIWVNGEPITIANPDPKMTLLEYLRESR
jgi:hypothetical protein